MLKKPYHEQIAEKLIEQLKQGTAPWQIPWSACNPQSMMPSNPLTGKRYRGINAIHLMSAPFHDTRWMTYKQAQQLGAQVKKGEHGTLIQYWKFSEDVAKKDDNGNPIKNAQGETIKIESRLERPRVFYATVFNAEQIEGLPPLEQKPVQWNSLERAETLLRQSNAKIFHHDTNRAFYRPLTDSIHLPQKSQFPDASRYYATALHELSHWSGHESRLNRDLRHPFGSEMYAKEELRAEIASMILGDELGIGHDPSQHVAYVKSWIKALQDDPLEIFRAAADAEKIQNFVLSFEQNLEIEHTIEQEPMQNINPVHEQAIDALLVQLKEGALAKTASVEKIWLDIPFMQKETAKQIAGTLTDGRCAISWDKTTSRWFAREGADLDKLKPWLPGEKATQTTAKVIDVTETKNVEKIWLSVPYEQRETVKQLAGKREDGKNFVAWDKSKKCWFAYEGVEIEKIRPWLIENNISRQTPALTPAQEFTEVLKNLGCLVEGQHPILDGNTHRIAVDGDKKGQQSGFYVVHTDGHPAGYAKNNRTGIETRWKSKGYILDETQKNHLQSELNEKLQARQKEHEQMQLDAADRVVEKMKTLIPVYKKTPYLETKGLPAIGGLYTDEQHDMTYVPLMDVEGKIWSLQSIKEDGTKRFEKGTKKTGCFHVLGGMSLVAMRDCLIIAEGYATAASIMESLRTPVIAAFDAGNLKTVALALHEKFPDKPVIIIGDDDIYLEQTKGINPGRVKAEEAAKAVGGVAVFPVFAPNEQENNPKRFTDFNDLANHSVLGKEAVRRQIKHVMNRVMEEKKQALEPQMQARKTPSLCL